MRLEGRFLRTRVARRVLALFMVGAIVPVAVMSLLSFTAVSSQLQEQSEARLAEYSEIASQAILQRLSTFRAVLHGIRGMLESVELDPARERADLSLPPGVLGLALQRGDDLRTIAGDFQGGFPLSEADLQHLREGEAIVRTRVAPAGPTSVVLAIAMNEGGEPPMPILWGQVEGDSVWAPIVTLTADAVVADVCVIDSAANPFFCAAGEASVLPGRLPPPATGGDHSGRIEVSGSDDESSYVVAWRAVYLRSSYRAPSWSVAVSQSRAQIYAPLRSFAYYLPLSVLIGFVAVILLSNVVLRRTMEPLERLTEGTARLAQHDLSVRVVVDSGDEFGDLAASFNEMAEQIGQQFRRLEAGRAIDHAVLTASEPLAALRAFLGGVGEVIPCERRGVLLFKATPEGGTILFEMDGADSTVRKSPHAILPGDATWLRDTELSFVALDAREAVPPFHTWFERAELALMILPVAVQGEPVGVVALAREADRGFSEAESRHARQLVNQAAVALDEVKLRRELVETGWEALRALANAIDAKSRWTSGHSERVTSLALAMGRELGLGERDMDVLHRGGLLHDIGKIGVSASVLDSPHELDPVSRSSMREHPVIGAKILEPIRSLKPAIPMVLQHHERWDGAGYPRGLSEDAIDPLARLLSVADVFDAMHSDRPYRRAMSIDVVAAHIRLNSGAAFDPRMVEAFDSALAAGFVPDEPNQVRHQHAKA